MATRNFIQQGAAYGSVPTSIVVTLDGKEIYSGPATTTDQPLPPMPGTDIDDTACEWTLPADFSGPLTFTVQVTGSTFILADSLADRTDYANTEAFDPWNYQQIINGATVIDPFTNVTIDGVSKTRDSALDGQWYWTINPGQTFSGTLNITAGITYPDWDPAQSYAPSSNVVYQTKAYSNGITSSAAGIVPSENPEIWFTLPMAVWNISDAYSMWDRVQHSGSVYMAIQNVPAGTDIQNTSYWEYRTSP